MSKKVNKEKLIDELKNLQDSLSSQVNVLQRCINDCENTNIETIEDMLNCVTATDSLYWGMRYFEYINSKITERFGVLKDVSTLLKIYDEDADVSSIMSSILDRKKSPLLGFATINMAESILDDKLLTKQET